MEAIYQMLTVEAKIVDIYSFLRIKSFLIIVLINYKDISICRSPSYNAGMTTLNSHGKILLSAEAILVTTHELGHNFGSFHDDEMEGASSECAPSSVSCFLPNVCLTFSKSL